MVLTRTRRRIKVAVVATVTAGAVAGGLLVWSTARADDRDESVRAQLNYRTHTITLPLDEFRVSGDEINLVLNARDAIVSRCLTEKGQQPVRRAPRAGTDDRRYGLWDVDSAAKFGFGMAPRTLDGTTAARRSEVNACIADRAEELEAVTPVTWMGRPQLADELESRALSKAVNDADWRAVHDDFASCLRKNGLSIDTRGSGAALQSQQGVDIIRSIGAASDGRLAEQQRIAVIEAQCNVDVSATQRRGDVEAQYQAPLIKENRAALERERTAVQELLDRARAAL